MTAELKQNAATGAPASSWKPYPAFKDSGVEWLGKVLEPGSETANIFQTGLTGSTGCVLLFNPVHPVILSRINKPQMNADERRLIAPVHREERKAELHKSLSIYIIIRPGTRMPRIKQIFTDNPIRAYPRQPLRQLTSPTRMALAIRGEPRSIVFEPDKKIRNQRHFSSITEQEATQ